MVLYRKGSECERIAEGEMDSVTGLSPRRLKLNLNGVESGAGTGTGAE